MAERRGTVRTEWHLEALTRVLGLLTYSRPPQPSDKGRPPALGGSDMRSPSGYVWE